MLDERTFDEAFSDSSQLFCIFLAKKLQAAVLAACSMAQLCCSSAMTIVCDSRWRGVLILHDLTMTVMKTTQVLCALSDCLPRTAVCVVPGVTHRATCEGFCLRSLATNYKIL